MKYLGIDYGSKRVGLAISDDSGVLAFPHSVILNNKDLIKQIAEIINQEKIETVVLGESKNFENKPNPIMKDIEIFKDNLNKTSNIKVIYESELFTSEEAKRSGPPKEKLDASAAAIILQSYLDKKNK